jgi:cytochrome c5
MSNSKNPFESLGVHQTNRRMLRNAALAAALVTIALAAQAYEGDWKRGRIYYRSVCTSCHVTLPMGSIAPNTRLKLEWAAYLAANKHARGKETVSQYASKSYRETIKANNKAAEKYIDVPEAELMADLKAFFAKGAKDGDAPATCN